MGPIIAYKRAHTQTLIDTDIRVQNEIIVRFVIADNFLYCVAIRCGVCGFAELSTISEFFFFFLDLFVLYEISKWIPRLYIKHFTAKM